MPTHKQIHFSIDIAASVPVVFHTMLDPETYKDWTTPFAEGSHYVGTWQQGEKIIFQAQTDSGMVSEIAEHRVNEFTSIRHVGQLVNGIEDSQSDAVRAWAPAYENYTFIATPEGTQVVVDQDVSDEWEQYLAKTWPLALQRLKALCESGGAA